MAIDYRKVEEMNERERDTKSTKAISLKTKANRARVARGKLVVDDRTDNYGEKQLKSLLQEQKDYHGKLVQQLENTLEELQTIKKEMTDVSYLAKQMAINGVGKAQEKAEEITMKNLDAVQEKYLVHIEILTRESQKRIERLRKTARINHFIPITTWIMVVMIFVMFCYLLWVK
ncbi:hypothetical protein AB1I62_03970 [Enterococcus sp. AN402]|uniref:hypothetical protein n=1 Tax=Enterococcus sp. AN402 TaxID=3151386 RepID=UPI003457C1B5